MISKDYIGWHTKKSLLNDKHALTYFYEREVWWAAIGHNIGNEEDGKGYNFARPVLILRKFNHSLFYGIPLSSAIKQGKYYHELTLQGEKRTALLSHMRDYDARRLINKLDVISEADYIRLQLALISLLRKPARIYPRNF